jgi:hypothetical protein
MVCWLQSKQRNTNATGNNLRSTLNKERERKNMKEKKRKRERKTLSKKRPSQLFPLNRDL